MQRDLTLDEPDPEWTSPDLTGQYVATSEGISYTLQLNQAGHDLEGWLQRHGPAAGTLVTSEIRGDWQRGRAGGSLVEFSSRRVGEHFGRQTTWVGSLVGSNAAGTFELLMTEQRQGPREQAPHDYDFGRTDTRPRLSQAAIRSTGSAVRAVAAASQRAPLTPAEDAFLVELAPYLVTDAQQSQSGTPPGEQPSSRSRPRRWSEDAARSQLRHTPAWLGSRRTSSRTPRGDAWTSASTAGSC